MTERALSALAWRELLAAVRTPAIWAVMGAEVALLAAYLIVWGDGVPLVGARPVVEQFATTQWVFLGLALPWAAARRGAAPERDEIAQLAVFGAVRPAAVVTASVVASSGLLLAIASVGLPFALLAQQISAVPMSELWRTQLPLYGLSLCAAAITAACMLVVANRLLAWMAATAVTLAVVAAVPAGAAGTLALVTLGVIVSALLVSGADRRCWYLSEHA